MKKKLNPNSHKRLIGDASKSWSDLPLDLFILVFERLSFADFQRAKSVCSSWLSFSRQCVPKDHIPWVLLFPKNNETNSCMLFNPEEKDKLYKTQLDLGLEFANSSCMKTYGSWLLMQNLQLNLYIVNLFTHERINLPPVKSQFGMTKIQSPVFWIDDETKDHVVSWALTNKYRVVYSISKTGDNSWNKIPITSSCLDMVYKDHKLYLLSYSESLKIFDFSGEIPQQIVVAEKHTVPPLVFYQPVNVRWLSMSIVATSIVVTATGDVLKVVKKWTPRSRSWSFRLYKVYSLGFKEDERVYSLGDEAMFLDLGITVLANDNAGMESVEIPSISVIAITVIARTQIMFFSSISRQARWRSHTNLIARLFNSLVVDGFYQVIHKDMIDVNFYFLFSVLCLPLLTNGMVIYTHASFSSYE